MHVCTLVIGPCAVRPAGEERADDSDGQCDGSHSIDVRLSTMPVQHGESVVMRLLDQSAGLLSLDETGMPVHILKRVRSIIKRPHGMVLVTGPTGSGKTTTLYGALSEINQQESNSIPVQDTVQYRTGRFKPVPFTT